MSYVSLGFNGAAGSWSPTGRVVQRWCLVTMLRDIVGWPAFTSWSPTGRVVQASAAMVSGYHAS